VVAFRRCIFKSFVLRSFQANRLELLASHDLNAQMDVVAKPDPLAMLSRKS